MRLIKKILFDDIQEIIEIKGIQEEEFEQRLRGHVDQNKGGLISGSKSKFYGTVTNNRFKIWCNQIFGSDDITIYGKFINEGTNLIVHIEYIRNWTKKISPFIFIIFGGFLLIKSLIDKSLDWQYYPIILILFLLFNLVNYGVKVNEAGKISGRFQEIFKGKEINKK